jgi:hypothetical protein
VVCLTVVSYYKTEVSSVEWCHGREYWIVNDVEGSSRSPVYITISAFAWRDWVIPRKRPVRRLSRCSSQGSPCRDTRKHSVWRLSVETVQTVSSLYRQMLAEQAWLAWALTTIPLQSIVCNYATSPRETTFNESWAGFGMIYCCAPRLSVM